MKESTENVETLSRVEMHRLANKRVVEIAKEFTDGFDFLQDYPKSVTFFGSTRFKEDNPYYIDARKLAAYVVTKLGYSIISGGGPGIMEAANRGAYEAGGNSLGLLIKLPSEQVTNKYITKEFSSYYFFTRKVLLTFSAEAFIFYPGGFGTLDEFFEILTLIQTKKITHAPLICIGSDYWNKLKKFMEHEMSKIGAIEPDEVNFFHILDDHDKVIEIIKSVPVLVDIPSVGEELGINLDGSQEKTL